MSIKKSSLKQDQSKDSRQVIIKSNLQTQNNQNDKSINSKETNFKKSDIILNMEVD